MPGLALAAAFLLLPLTSQAQTIAPPLFRCAFAPGSATPAPACGETVSALRAYWSAAIGAGTPFDRLDVLGSAGPNEARRDPRLAQRRAEAVAALLTAAGFSRDRLSAEASALGEAVVLMDPHGSFRCLFASGSAVITPACTATLHGALAMVGDYPAARRAALEIDVNGFTDDREARAGLTALATRRAEAVVQALRALGLRTQTLNARGHGPEGALRPTSLPDPRARVVSLAVIPPASGSR